MSREDLARRQAALIAALVAGGERPAGFDPGRFDATAQALLRKRAKDVASHWPALAAAFGPQWTKEFAAWAAGKPSRGGFRDGFDFARSVHGLDGNAARELSTREHEYLYDGSEPPRKRSRIGRLIHRRRTG